MHGFDLQLEKSGEAKQDGGVCLLTLDICDFVIVFKKVTILYISLLLNMDY